MFCHETHAGGGTTSKAFPERNEWPAANRRVAGILMSRITSPLRRLRAGSFLDLHKCAEATEHITGVARWTNTCSCALETPSIFCEALASPQRTPSLLGISGIGPLENRRVADMILHLNYLPDAQAASGFFPHSRMSGFYNCTSVTSSRGYDFCRSPACQSTGRLPTSTLYVRQEE